MEQRWKAAAGRGSPPAGFACLQACGNPFSRSILSGRHCMHRSTLVSLCAMGAALGLASNSFAQCTPPITTIGPDVVVGDLTGPQNYAADSTYDAYSVGTYSCNIGNNWLNWIETTNQHPVIGQNIYKMKVQADGTTRFEQIGQSWLKHG